MVKIRQSPSQDVFNYFYNLSQEWGYNTFEFLPPVENDVEYPFVQIGEVGEVPGNTKTELTGAITLTINCWGTYKQRLAISEMVERFFYASIGHINTENYSYYGQVQQQSKQIITDTSVPDTTFMRGIVMIKLQIQ
ncbi:hypothetical protein HFC69_01360 [Pediococcus sp. EKM202D]|uniref:hypothetical protein n=1 Tax=unclassified Pediococcus TaxID=554805 RepID=UPI00142E3D38|nr:MULTISPECIES: hypothetical protein [unclassified Pediococcus]KAF5440923.1 hypothetical protein HFC69_01360 [Pediococcus sp. EKM202D]KAF5441514.1 hypothetical protein HFC68_01520 [Pediococcus sp. EKM201D]